jgi:hypothetical protein
MKRYQLRSYRRPTVDRDPSLLRVNAFVNEVMKGTHSKLGILTLDRWLSIRSWVRTSMRTLRCYVDGKNYNVYHDRKERPCWCDGYWCTSRSKMVITTPKELVDLLVAIITQRLAVEELLEEVENMSSLMNLTC